MESNQRYAWMLFGLAAVCAVAASAFAIMGNKSPAPTSPPSIDSDTDGVIEDPGYVPVMPVAPTVAPNQPATITTSAPTSVPVVPVTVAYTAPGGWVWNPMYTHGVYWDVRHDPHWHYDWKWWGKRDHWRYGGNWRRHHS